MSRKKPCSFCGNPIPDNGIWGLPTYTDVPENHKEDCPIREIMEVRLAQEHIQEPVEQAGQAIERQIVSELLFPRQARKKNVDDLLALCKAFLESAANATESNPPSGGDPTDRQGDTEPAGPKQPI